MNFAKIFDAIYATAKKTADKEDEKNQKLAVEYFGNWLEKHKKNVIYRKNGEDLIVTFDEVEEDQKALGCVRDYKEAIEKEMKVFIVIYDGSISMKKERVSDK